MLIYLRAFVVNSDVMKLVQVLFYINKFNKGLFEISVEEQMSYLYSLGNPTDDIDRSYKQFLCQEYFSPWWIKSFMFIVSVIAIIPILCIYWYKGIRISFIKQVDTIAEDKGMNLIIPDELSSLYAISHKEWNAGACLSSSDIFYIFKKVMGLKQPYFILKTIIKIASYSPRIIKYHPSRLICHSEFSFCSSILTSYCNSKGVRLINVQHGEKLLYIRDSFFRFDECYVWDKHYVNIFTKMKAELTQFRIAVPPSLKIDIVNNQKKTAFANYKYYLTSDNEEQIKSIVNTMSIIKSRGKTVKYRIHPRYTDLNILRKYVAENEIEYPKNISIEESVANIDYAIGSYTTVLLQAYLSGKKVLLDNVTYKKRYSQLYEYGYILANKNIEILSNAIK